MQSFMLNLLPSEIYFSDGLYENPGIREFNGRILFYHSPISDIKYILRNILTENIIIKQLRLLKFDNFKISKMRRKSNERMDNNDLYGGG